MPTPSSPSQATKYKYRFHAMVIAQFVLFALHLSSRSTQKFQVPESIQIYFPSATSAEVNIITSSGSSVISTGTEKSSKTESKVVTTNSSKEAVSAQSRPTSAQVVTPTNVTHAKLTAGSLRANVRAVESSSKAPIKEVTKNTTTFAKPPTNSSDFAYVFLMGGVDPGTPSTYLGFLYNVLASTYILRRDGSQADVVIYMQWKDQDKDYSLSENELRVLREMNITLSIEPVSKSNDHFFERLQMEKFQLWKMVQYKRILYLDADMFPLCNLDYIFDASMGEDAIIKPNMVFPGIKVPANGGAFLLTPSLKDHQRLQDLIDARFNKTYFDETTGWGHAIGQNETWHNFDGIYRGNKWDFYAAHVDQGLLWHWMRFENGTFSAPYPKPDGKDFKDGLNLSEAIIENWADGKLESVQPFNFSKYSCLPRHWPKKNMNFIKRPWFRKSFYEYPFHSDMIHFWEKSKPWLKTVPSEDKIVDREHAMDGIHFWFYALKQVDNQHQLGVNWTNFGDGMKVKHMKARQSRIT